MGAAAEAVVVILETRSLAKLRVVPLHERRTLTQSRCGIFGAANARNGQIDRCPQQQYQSDEPR